MAKRLAVPRSSTAFRAPNARTDTEESAHDYVHLMDSSEAEERVDRLLAPLDEGIALLDQHGESHWAQWMRTVRTEIQRHDPTACAGSCRPTAGWAASTKSF